MMRNSCNTLCEPVKQNIFQLKQYVKINISKNNYYVKTLYSYIFFTFKKSNIISNKIFFINMFL